MDKSNVVGLSGRAGSVDPLSELLRERVVRLEDGRAAVIRSGYHP